MEFWKYFFGNFFNFIKCFFSKILVGVQFIFLVTFVIVFNNYIRDGAIAILTAGGGEEKDIISNVILVNYFVGIFFSCISSILFALTTSELINRIYRTEIFDWMINVKTKKDIEIFLLTKHPFVYVANFLVPMVTIGLTSYLTLYSTFLKSLIGFLIYAFGHVVIFSYAMYIYHSEKTRLEVLEKLQGDD